MKLSKKLSMVALVSAFSLGTAGAALAQSGQDRQQQEQQQQQQGEGLSLADVERIALSEVQGGEITDFERERERGGDVIEVTVRDQQGVEHDLVIDADSGDVLSSQEDRD